MLISCLFSKAKVWVGLEELGKVEIAMQAPLPTQLLDSCVHPSHGICQFLIVCAAQKTSMLLYANPSPRERLIYLYTILVTPQQKESGPSLMPLPLLRAAKAAQTLNTNRRAAHLCLRKGRPLASQQPFHAPAGATRGFLMRFS